MRAKLIKSKPCDILVRRQQKKGHNFKNHVHDVRPTLRPRCTGYNYFSFWFQRFEAFLSSTKKNQSGVNYDLSNSSVSYILKQINFSWCTVGKNSNFAILLEYENPRGFLFVFHFMLFFPPSECFGLCRYRPQHSLREK